MKLFSLLTFSAFALGASASALLPPNQQSLEMVEGSKALMGGKTVWSNCGDEETDPVRINDIQVSPDPPKPGSNMTVTVRASVFDTIEDGAYVDVLVKIGVVTLLKKTFDICEEARNAETDIQCPVQEGEYTIVQTVELPKEIPPAKFSVTAHGWLEDDSPMTCVKIEVDFRKNLKFPALAW